MLHQTMAAKINETDRIRMARRITRKHSGIIARLFQPRRMMALIAGTQVGPYQILSLAGTGGMGEVYRARDPKLGRDVALKVLPDSLANDQERTARFEREARTLAALNHPNIASIYGFEAGALVMELVEGATPKGPMPFDEAWHIASQIIAALEYAHASGIIHRDLKPANIKVTADGVVKLLDFGLAKVFTEPGVEKSADLSNSPTLTMATEVGVILGTAAYMAPEQAKGRNVDKRADIWAFGVVLYELLTGHQLFQAEDVSETLAHVLTKQPDWNKVPPKARALLQACLEKDPKRRLRDIGDSQRLLQNETAQSPEANRRTISRKFASAMFAVLLVVAILLAAATGIVVWNSRPTPSTAITRFSFAIPEAYRLLNSGTPIIAMSPDGSNIVYIANQQLYLRSMSDPEAHPVQGTAKGPYTPFFSPDGNWIGFYSRLDGKFEKVAVSGGAPLPICDAEFLPWSATWGPDDKIYFTAPAAGIQRAPANGGTAEVVVASKRGEFFSSPQILPDGDGLMFSLARTSGFTRWDKAQIVVQSLKSGSRKVVFEGGSDARYVPTGHLVYALGSTLYAIRFDVQKLQVAGGPVEITEGVRRSVDATTAATVFAFSNSGSMVYVPGGTTAGASGERILAMVDRKGMRKPLPIPPGFYAQPRISQDGKQLALYSDDGKDSAIQIYDLSGTTPLRRLTFTGRNYKPVWTRDGQHIVYTSDRDGDEAIYWQRADGTGSAERLAHVEQGVSPQSEAWSLDGKTLIVNLRIGGRSAGLATVTAGQDQKPKMLIPGGGNPSLSPDGKWIAYPFLDSIRQNVYVQAFPPNETKYLISTADKGGNNPLWSPDGKQLYYLTLDSRQVMSVDVRQSGAGLSLGKPTPLPIEGIAQPGPRSYDIMPDGTFIALFPEAQPGPAGPQVDQLNITLNWFTELRQRVPVK
jgi:serine/threonine protein kinase